MAATLANLLSDNNGLRVFCNVCKRVSDNEFVQGVVNTPP